VNRPLHPHALKYSSGGHSEHHGQPAGQVRLLDPTGFAASSTKALRESRGPMTRISGPADRREQVIVSAYADATGGNRQ